MTVDSPNLPSDAALAEIIAGAVGFELPGECEPGVFAAWRALAAHWASLAAQVCDD